MVLVFTWTTGIAYLTSSLLYQLGTMAAHPGFSLAWLAGCAVVLFVAIHQLKHLGRRAVRQSLIPVVQLS
jgi:ferrous iron transport protein B